MFPSKILIELMFPSNYQKFINVSLYDKNTFHKNKNLKFILKKKKEREEVLGGGLATPKWSLVDSATSFCNRYISNGLPS